MLSLGTSSSLRIAGISFGLRSLFIPSRLRHALTGICNWESNATEHKREEIFIHSFITASGSRKSSRLSWGYTHKGNPVPAWYLGGKGVS